MLLDIAVTDPGTMSQNPFAMLTAIVAPAVLTNACSVLSLGTGNRLARVVDRTREIAVELTRLERNNEEYNFHIRQMEALQERAQLLVRALRAFYGSLGGFAAAALLSLLGAALVSQHYQVSFRGTAIVALVLGVYAVGSLAFGCILMVRETRIAVQHLGEEAEWANRRYR
ncbi:MAG: DUF2721 domain-containing protein [Candidatus Korobacteraceae bacterium]